ncbi:dehydrin COR47-like [Lycium barbarum]|uniref:dehydrin COR47-like n=1 Tax=Lycium barbarum TaxID=112863 RepID=UPI00293E7462|nr:dehydrin COR47-like [Lycium barbarum]
MADQHEHNKTSVEETGANMESRGLFDFLGKKEEEKPTHAHEEQGLKDKIKDKISGEHKEGEKTEKVGDTSVPVGKYEESEEKKGFLDKIKEKLPGDGQKRAEEVAPPPPAVAEHEADGKEKKGLMDKIKEKLPCDGQKRAEEVAPPPPAVAEHEADGKEKKGLMDKINEKLPGYHPKTEEEKEAAAASH